MTLLRRRTGTSPINQTHVQFPIRAQSGYLKTSLACCILLTAQRTNFAFAGERGSTNLKRERNISHHLPVFATELIATIYPITAYDSRFSGQNWIELMETEEGLLVRQAFVFSFLASTLRIRTMAQDVQGRAIKTINEARRPTGCLILLNSLPSRQKGSVSENLSLTLLPASRQSPQLPTLEFRLNRHCHHLLIRRRWYHDLTCWSRLLRTQDPFL
ncbi:hypothetical protein BC567DRAFT_100186 [Phyllosticta citribraziliensis]